METIQWILTKINTVNVRVAHKIIFPQMTCITRAVVDEMTGFTLSEKKDNCCFIKLWQMYVNRFTIFSP